MPSLSLADEAIELFTDRARRARPDFRVTDDNAALVTEICARLDGMPLAIELAAARVRALSLAEILDSLHDRFRLLTGGARTAVRRQQTLRASVDWSHALLTEPERVLLRRLAVFLGGFDLDAAQAVGAGDGEVERYQVLDQLSLLVDKSLVVADDIRRRERGTGCWRQCGSTRPRNSGSPARPTLCGRVTAITTRRWPRGSTPRRAVTMSSASSRPTSRSTTCAPRSGGAAKTPTSSWRWHWRRRCSRCGSGGAASGKGWPGSTPPSPISTRSSPRWRPRCARGRSPTGRCSPPTWGPPDSLDQAQQALAIAREVDDPALLVRALTACGPIAVVSAELAGPYFAEAIGLARALGDRWRLSQILAWQARAAATAGDPIAVRAAAEEGRDLAEAIGDRFDSRQCRWCLGTAQLWQGDLAGAAAQFGAVAAEAEAAHDVIYQANGLAGQGMVLAWQGEMRCGPGRRRRGHRGRRRAGRDCRGPRLRGVGYRGPGRRRCCDGAGRERGGLAAPECPARGRRQCSALVSAQAALAGGDLVAARRWADDAVATTTGLVADGGADHAGPGGDRAG